MTKRPFPDHRAAALALLNGTSRLSRKSDDIRQSGVDARTANHPEYLLDVDNELVLPVGTKIRFLLTADDVIHS